MQELETTVSARELADWGAYWSVEPWGAERDNIHAGIVAAMVFNVHRGKDAEPRKFEDFLLREVVPGQENYAKTINFVAGLRALAKPKRK